MLFLSARSRSTECINRLCEKCGRVLGTSLAARLSQLSDETINKVTFYNLDLRRWWVVANPRQSQALLGTWTQYSRRGPTSRQIRLAWQKRNSPQSLTMSKRDDWFNSRPLWPRFDEKSWEAFETLSGQPAWLPRGTVWMEWISKYGKFASYCLC